jgi:hypothetical protein
MTSTRKLAVAFAAARGLYGVALAVTPGSVGTSWLGDAAEAPSVHVALRGLAARDLALAAGTIDAAAREVPLRPWLLASVGCDVSDIAATLVAGHSVPPRARVGTLALAGISALAGAALAATADR